MLGSIDPLRLRSGSTLNEIEGLTRRTEKRTIQNMTTISATQARANLYDLIDEVSLSGKRIGITKKGETKVVLMSIEELESWEETNEILSDKKLMKDLREAEEDIKKGHFITFEQLKKDLKLDV